MYGRKSMNKIRFSSHSNRNIFTIPLIFASILILGVLVYAGLTGTDFRSRAGFIAGKCYNAAAKTNSKTRQVSYSCPIGWILSGKQCCFKQVPTPTPVSNCTKNGSTCTIACPTRPPAPTCPAGKMCVQNVAPPPCTAQKGICQNNRCVGYPTPTPTIACRTGVTSFSVDTPCTTGNRYATFTCYDGTSRREGGPTTCKPSDIWYSDANEYCKNRPNCSYKTPTPTATCVPKPACVDGIVDPKTGMKVYCTVKVGTVFCTPPPRPTVVKFSP
jgi:hypothetical protein